MTIQKDINNQIILLRQSVRQARICIINRLIREAKKLRTNRGNEKQLEKNRNKSEKLLREVSALKLIKDDEISKFGITALESLQEIIQNPHSDDNIRVMAKVIRYKALNTKIMEFREKFPDYNKHIVWNKKKHVENKKKGMKKVSEGIPKELSTSENNTKAMEFMKNEKDDDTDKNPFIDLSENVITQQNIKTDEKYNEQEEFQLSRQQLKGDKKKLSCNIDGAQKSKSNIKVISEEAAVKRFTDILQETDIEEKNSDFIENSDKQLPHEVSVETPRMIDDFFLDSDKIMLNSNMTKSIYERKSNNMPMGSNSIFNASKHEGRKFRSNQMNIEQRNYKKQKSDNKSVSYKKNTLHLKQNKKIIGIENKSMQGNVEITSSFENKNLHPSWVARKKQQEIMKQGFQGTKIRFDEN
ncbi:uncharacterized protein LOC143177206 [Calliopsis andreniformis]|uniref:uncharacterized protein LOC143177206 n=1 Tax=Calliopsis andreniformis TaxID=337506 RepID=UPI003FCE0E5F